ncbi:MAG TPA: hypothetical protein VK172_14690 [Lentimicrobium sp.]|nr:hypothetical protein [Bacteroidales bacterium]HLO92409.1 hypothetical protein [Lentimicrobium sp.]
MLKEVKILKGQTLADIAIQETGELAGLFQIAFKNGISLTDDLAAGEVIQVDDLDINISELRKIRLDNVVPATAFGYVVNEEGEEPILDGIGYWSVGMDFIVL